MAESSVLLTHAAGLHARPAVKFTKLAKTFSAKIEFGHGDTWIDAKSIVKVMGAKVPGDTTLRIRADGEDAQAAVTALVDLVTRDFDESETDGDDS